jgi:tetratricopeptide (TPR) repeat protein
MVGLPRIHTIGACAGKMVGMVSPGDMDEEFNWARVVKHEFVHVINLQQTNFNIPHWFTEALAVYNEGNPRPGKWNAMLARRVPAGEVYNLDTINLGFIRPSNSEDWQMAYCQAELYAEYVLERYGDDALAKMLNGYADNLSTIATLQRAFDVTKEDFEKGYQQHVAKVVKELPPAKRVVKAESFADMEQALQEDPENPDLLGDVAIGYLRRKAYPKARSLAVKAIKHAPNHQAATYVMVRLQLVIGDTTGVTEKLDKALNPDDPQPDLLKLLAGLKYKTEEYDEAASLYELGRRHFPGDVTWLNQLLRVHQKSLNKAKVLPLLEEKALADPDDLLSRRTLAETSLADEDYDEAARWALEAIYIDVLDVDMHRILAEASVELREHDTAIREFEVAIELKPQQLQLRLALADACVEAGEKEKAKTVLRKLLELDPDYPGADVLLESLTS